MELIDDVYCINGLGVDSNSYLIEDVLVDTGTGQNKDYLHFQIKELGFDVEDIKTIVNTHCHFDHVGGNYLFPEAKVAIHGADEKSLTEDNSLTVSSMFSCEILRKDVDIILKEGDKIKGFEVLHTPGHSNGSICLFNGKTLISGDTVFAEGFGRVDIGGNILEMRESLKRLTKLNVEYLLPGHGPWISNAKLSIERASKLANY